MATTTIDIDEAIVRVKQGGITAIVRGSFETNTLLSFADALSSEGVTAMEVTLNSPNATSHIAALRRHVSDRMLIGAGTVRNVSQVDESIDAGAQFLVSPGFDLASVTRSLAHGVLHLPGVFTATEAQQAASAGCRMLKLFPADTLGPVYLKALRAPLDDVDFVPTGGVSPTNAAAWRKAGAVAIAVGSTLIAGANQTADDLAKRARELRSAWAS